MLKLKNERSSIIAEKHFDGVRFYINQVLEYYINAFEILIGNKSPSDAVFILYNNSYLDANFINTLGGKLCFMKRSEKKITKLKIIEIYSKPNIYINNLFIVHKAGFKLFFEELKTNLKLIITGSPKELLLFQEDIKTKFPFVKENNGLFKEPLRRLLLQSVFNYNKFSNKQGLPKSSIRSDYWERYDLAKELNVNTCAYCNRVYTFTVISESGIGVISPTIDHFFDKAKNPLFALSFYNLIPSCTNCNSILKGCKELSLEDYVHPYLGGFGGHAKFNYIPLDVDSLIGESVNLKVFIDLDELSPINHQIKNNIDLFQLDIIYTQHGDQVRELIKKKIMSNNRYIEILRHETYKGLSLTLEESYRLAFGNYYSESEFSKRPLSKMIKDLVERLKMI